MTVTAGPEDVTLSEKTAAAAADEKEEAAPARPLGPGGVADSIEQWRQDWPDSATPVRPQTLIVLVHGNHGRAVDFAPHERELRTSHADVLGGGRAVILRSNRNQLMRTHDGIARMAERLVDEIEAVLDAVNTQAPPPSPSEEEEKKYDDDESAAPLISLSLVGHSMGGLVCRYAAKTLVDRGLVDTQLELTSFISLSSPHLGAQKSWPAGAAALNPISWVWRSAVGCVLRSGLYGLTGREISYSDKQDKQQQGEGQLPLLVEMATRGRGFLEALDRFKVRTIAGLVNGDLLVPIASSSIRSSCPQYDGLANFGAASWRVVGHEGFSVDEARELFGGNDATAPSTTPTASSTTPSSASAPAAAEQQEQEEQQQPRQPLLDDSRSELQYDPRALAGLQTVRWRRIDLQFVSGGPLVGTALTLNTHSFLIKKIQVHKALSSEAVAMVDKLLVRDVVLGARARASL